MISFKERQQRISFVKQFFADQLAQNLSLIEVQAPLLSKVMGYKIIYRVLKKQFRLKLKIFLIPNLR